MKLILIILSLSFTLQADYLSHYLDSKCNTKMNKAEMTISNIYNTDMNTTQDECVFSNGDKIKMKLGRGRTFPYGQGGAIPDLWASVWVNEVKIASRVRASCPSYGDGVCSFYIKSYNNIVEICDLNYKKYYKKFENNDMRVAPTKDTDFTCKKIKIDDINGTKDYVEYPKNGKKLKVGNFKNFYTKSKNFCNKFLENGKYSLPSGSKGLVNTIIHSSSRPIEFARMKKADYDNDGIIDDAYSLHIETHPRDRTIFYILPKDNNISKTWPNISEKTLVKYKKTVFPDDTISGEFFKLLVPIPTNKEDKLRITYFLYPSPFILNGVVYFDMHSMHRNIGSEHIIVKLLPNNKVEHLCYFYEIEENY